jgi:hypothetical protein
MSYPKNKFKLYDTKRWVRRARTHLTHHPLCVMCLDHGSVVPAQVADHIAPHKEDPYSFWYGELQSLCHTCHSGPKQIKEHCGFMRDIGIDGYPIDPDHPANKDLVAQGIGPSGAGFAIVSGGGGISDRYADGPPPNRAALFLA